MSDVKSIFHLPFARPQLARVPSKNVIVQPKNERCTAA